MNIGEYIETLKIHYDLYKQCIDEGYRVLTYLEWLEMNCFKLTEEIQRLHKIDLEKSILLNEKENEIEGLMSIGENTSNRALKRLNNWKKSLIK